MPGYHLPYFAADTKGIWAAHGLTVELVEPEPGPDNIRAAAAGRYDACITSVAHFLRAAADEPGLAARFVLMATGSTHLAAFVVEGRPAAHGRVVSGFSDLDGASFIGPPESGFAKEYSLLLRHVGASPGPPVDVPYHDVIDVWAQGGGDVAVEFAEFLPDFEAAARHRGARTRCLRFADAGLDIYGSGVVAGRAFLDDRPEIVHRLVAAVRDALALTRAEPEVGLAALLARYPEADPVRAVEGWRAGESLIFGTSPFGTSPFGTVGAMDSDRWRRTIAHHAAAHGTPSIEPENAFDGRFAQ